MMADPFGPGGDEAVSSTHFNRIMTRLGPWSPDTPVSGQVALAVSGGGDSLALAWLARQWRRNLVAFVVDHGLRPESAAEAAATLRTLEKMGIAARLLTLTSLQPGPGIAERARKARYAALTKACRQAGSLSLLLGHQADDQAETIAMRRARGDGAGLAGMAWITEQADIRLVRPLLGASRLSLRNTLRQAGISWCDDPSNENEKAERVRVRKRLTRQECSDLILMAVQAGERRQKSEARIVAELVHAGISFSSMGWVALGNRLPSSETLAALIRCVGGSSYPPSLRAVAVLVDRNRAGTLAGTRLLRARLTPGQAEEWILTREPAAMEGAVPARSGAVWDHRFALQYDGDLTEFTIGAAGNGLKRERRAGLSATLCATLPALWRGEQRVCIPHLGFCDELALQEASFRFTPPVAVTTHALWSPLPLV
ncbi:tRNA lysidine(34) synthetase TilS [Acetobacter fallax]|uniref:tRNA(Ile)-lysidine synthase n=1 Tax=Acetobacter fallax TaxID=1737473 RepID=A0ABX0KC45_9PROT|nr:tRNA lysidine(34) synthetase TilS [Acetobacter fallax]NHO33721.1 tRNA lysidine(34) synthetase TilS [Acetobacter fallax]NHO37282.1 tRNA lysidine(34) synthetase TilS [Acetobacter fallax]